MMTTYKLNTRLLLATGVVLLLGVAGSVSLHGWQINRHAREQESLANQAREKGEPRAELSHLFRWLSFEPDADDARARHALVLSREAKNSRDRARALYTLKEALMNDPTSETLRLRTAELALETGDAGDALQFLTPLLEKESPRAEWFELAAKCHLANQSEANARTALRRALEIAPDHFDTANQLIELLEKDPQQSRPLQAVLNQLVKANPRAVQAWLIRAKAHMRKSEWAKASLDLAQARAVAPRDLDTLLLSAEVAGRLNKTDEAILYRQQALKEQPTNAALYLAQARDEKARGKLDAAIATLRAGSKEVPYNSDLYFHLADLLIEKGAVAEANEWLGRLPETQARGRIAFIKGRQAMRERRWLEAAERFAEALPEKDLLPEDRQQLLLNLANCYGQLGAGDEQYLATALAAQTRYDPQALLRQAEWLNKAGRGSEAIPLLEKLSRLPSPPRGTWPLLARVLLDRNRLLPLAQRRWPEVEQAISRLENDADTRRLAPPLRAEVLELRRQPTEARSLLEKDLKDHPRDLDSYLALADLLLRLDEGPAAQDVLLQGDKAFPGSLAWIQARASRIVSAGSGDILDQLKALEERGKDLGENDRDQLDRALVEWYARLHFHKEVERLANALLKKAPQDIRLRQLLVDACLARGDQTEARKWIEQIRKIEGENGLAWREASVALELDRAERGQKAGLKSARKWLEEILQQRPNWTQAAYLLGRLSDLEQKPDEALAAYRRSLAGAEPHPLALSRCIRLLTERKQWTEALGMVEKALRLGQLDRLARRDAAWIAVRAGRPDRARELALAVVPPDKSRPLDLLWLGRLLAAAGFETEANEAYLRAQSLAPQLLEVWLDPIAHYLSLRQIQRATDQMALMKDKVDPDIRDFAMGRAEDLFHHFDEAEKWYRSHLERNPHDADALERLAKLYLRQNRPLDAEKVLLKMLQPRVSVLEEDLPGIRRMLALVLTAPEQPMDRVDTSLAILALNRGPAGESALDHRLSLLVRGRRAGDRAGVLKALEELSADPEPGAEEQLRLAQLHQQQGDWPRARSLLLTLLNRDEENPGVMAALVDGLLRNGKFAEAAIWLPRLEKLEPTSSRVQDLRKRLRDSTKKPDKKPPAPTKKSARREPERTSLA